VGQAGDDVGHVRVNLRYSGTVEFRYRRGRYCWGLYEQEQYGQGRKEQDPSHKSCRRATMRATMQS
jgi:hypothetical protein